MTDSKNVVAFASLNDKKDEASEAKERARVRAEVERLLDGATLSQLKEIQCHFLLRKLGC